MMQQIVLNYIHNIRKQSTKAKIFNIFFPDKFIDHALPEEQYRSINMDYIGIEKKVYEILKIDQSFEIKSKTIISE